MASGISAGIENVERLYADVGTQEGSLMEQVLFLYYAGVDIEVTVGTAEKAFEYSEALRGRGFLAEMGTTAALRLPGITEAERKNIERLTQEITSTRNILDGLSSQQAESAVDITRSADASRRLNALEIELATLNASITDRIPQYGILRNPAPVSIKDARSWCGEDTAVLEYVLWDDTVEFNPVTRGFIWEGMTEKPTINSYCLVLTQDGVTPVLLDHTFDYTGTIKQFRQFVAESRGAFFVETMRGALYEKLVKPALPYIPENIKSIVIVPDGQLAYLPFDILRENNDSPDFGETYALSLSPSVSVSILAQKRDFQNDGTILAFADAVYNQDEVGTDRGQRAFDGEKWNNLPGTAAEIASLQKIARSHYHDITVYMKDEVRESVIKELSARRRLRQYPIIHFACHGYFDENDPSASGIVLSEVSETHEPDDENDGYLTIPEIAVLEFNSKMVLLSACETGLGETKRGQGMVGLSRAFLVAGGGNVGVSLWKIDDSGTSLFMEALYTKVLAENKTFRQAYYEVKNEFRHGKFGEQYTLPLYWAAFILYE
jgi:CHAT domain-containing protein